MTLPVTIQDHDTRYCGARKRQGPGTCRRPAGWGTNHPGVGRCKLHGGSTRSLQRAAQRQSVETAARGMLERLGQPEPLGHPVEELLAVAAEPRAWQHLLREQVSELDRLTSTDIAMVERARAVVELYTQALRDTERILVSLLKLDLDTRRVQLAEAQAHKVIEVLNHTLTHPDVGLSEEQVETARRVAARRLRDVSQPA